MARPGAFLYYRNANYRYTYILVRTLLSTQEYTYIYTQSVRQPCSPFTRKHRFVAVNDRVDLLIRKMVMALSSRFSRVILALCRNGMGQYALNALPGLTQTGSEETLAYFPQPMAKKSPTGTSTEGSFSSSQYLRKIENRQFPLASSKCAQSRRSR